MWLTSPSGSSSCAPLDCIQCCRRAVCSASWILNICVKLTNSDSGGKQSSVVMPEAERLSKQLRLWPIEKAKKGFWPHKHHLHSPLAGGRVAGFDFHVYHKCQNRTSSSPGSDPEVHKEMVLDRRPAKFKSGLVFVFFLWAEPQNFLIISYICVNLYLYLKMT